MVCDDKKVNKRNYGVKEESVKLLCVLSTVKTNRFYIPGETSIVETLRKHSFDRGLFAALTHIYQTLEKNDTFPEIRTYIKEKVLNLIELKDLYYHC